MRLHDFSRLSLDCYGTPIDWESGILTGSGNGATPAVITTLIRSRPSP